MTKGRTCKAETETWFNDPAAAVSLGIVVVVLAASSVLPFPVQMLYVRARAHKSRHLLTDV